MPSSTHNSRPVYATTGISRIMYCRDCGQPEDHCRCRAARARSAGPAAQVPRDGTVRLLRDRAGRKGKAMTLVVGLPDDPTLLEELARSLKKLAGVGGTVQGDVIALQGDVRATIRPRLEALGYTVKIAGG